MAREGIIGIHTKKKPFWIDKENRVYKKPKDIDDTYLLNIINFILRQILRLQLHYAAAHDKLDRKLIDKETEQLITKYSQMTDEASKRGLRTT